MRTRWLLQVSLRVVLALALLGAAPRGVAAAPREIAALVVERALHEPAAARSRALRGAAPRAAAAATAPTAARRRAAPAPAPRSAPPTRLYLAHCALLL